MGLNWKAVRKGDRYCAPACGGGCTHAEYLQAKKASKVLAGSLGYGWTAHVWENLGWHWTVKNESRQLELGRYRDGEFHATILCRFIGRGRSPHQAIRAAVKEGLVELPAMKAAVACLEANW